MHPLVPPILRAYISTAVILGYPLSSLQPANKRNGYVILVYKKYTAANKNYPFQNTFLQICGIGYHIGGIRANRLSMLTYNRINSCIDVIVGYHGNSVYRAVAWIPMGGSHKVYGLQTLKCKTSSTTSYWNYNSDTSMLL
jgi:hypothetical protein